MLKEFHEGTDSDNQLWAARQYDAAIAAQRSFELETHLSIARPLAICRGALLLADVPGESSLPILNHGPLPQATRLAATVGEWFATYHRVLPRQDGGAGAKVEAAPLKLASEIRDIEAGFSSIDVRGRPSPGVFEYLHQAAAASVAMEPSHCVRLHGDSKPSNFLFDGEVLYGIDIEGRYLGIPERDLAQFEAQLRASATTWYGAADQARLTTIASALAAGYCRRARLDRPRLEALRLICLLKLWLKLTSSSGIGAWRWNGPFARHVDGMLSEGSECLG